MFSLKLPSTVHGSLLMELIALVEPLAQVLDPEVGHEIDLAIKQGQRPRLLRPQGTADGRRRRASRDGGGSGDV